MLDLDDITHRDLSLPGWAQLCYEAADGSAINAWDSFTKVLTLEVDPYYLNYDRMSLISTLFGTRDINYEETSRSEGYCETCSYDRPVTIVTIRGITNWPIDNCFYRDLINISIREDD